MVESVLLEYIRFFLIGGFILLLILDHKYIQDDKKES